MDEEAERVEQEALARREQALLDLQAAQTEAANREAAEQGDETMVEGEGERDLDEDVPEAAASDDSSVSGSVSSSDISDSELVEDDESEEEQEEVDASVLDTTQADMTFNEESFLEGSMLAHDQEPDRDQEEDQEQEEVAHMLELEEAEMSGILQEERDLDDDIPEAGEYEHTDTELSLESDEEGSSRLSASLLSNRRVSAPGTAPRRSTRRNSGFQSMHVRSTTRSVRTTRSSLSRATHTHPRSSIGTQSRSSITPHELVHEEPRTQAQEQRPQRPQRVLPPPRLFDPRQSFNFDANASFGFDGSSSLFDGSSFLHSSPAATRGSHNLRGARFVSDARSAPPRG